MNSHGLKERSYGVERWRSGMGYIDAWHRAKMKVSAFANIEVSNDRG